MAVPRPEYRDSTKKTIYAEIDPEIKSLLKDICWTLDLTEKEALPLVIQYYADKEKIKARPAKKRLNQNN